MLTVPTSSRVNLMVCDVLLALPLVSSSCWQEDSPFRCLLFAAEQVEERFSENNELNVALKLHKVQGDSEIHLNIIIIPTSPHLCKAAFS